MTRKIFIRALLVLLVLAGCGEEDGPGALNDLIDQGGALSGAGCQFVTDDFGPDGGVPIRAETVVNGLEVPWGIGFLPNGDMLVTERPGRVRHVVNGQLLPNAVATIAVGEAGEGGLLGIAIHPNFTANRFFYVYYTVNKGGRTVNRVERYRLTDDGAAATADRILIDDIPAGTFHNGGRLRFGPDGNLYVGTGDARDPNNSQNQNSPAGKILKLSPDGGAPTVFVSGVRNVEAFDWLNPATLIVADHGPTGELSRTGGDEVSVASAGTNLGWPTIWQCEQGAGTSPILSWQTAVPPGGAAIYTGSAIPEWRGNFIIGTLGSTHLHRVVLSAENGAIGVASHEVYLRGTHGRLRDVVNGPDGFLYVTTSNCDGRGSCPATKDEILRIRLK